MEWLYGIVGLLPILLFVIAVMMRKARIIESPKLGFYNLSSTIFAPLLEIDKESLGYLFSGVIESTDIPPTCNVLFLYCQFEPDGSVLNSDLSLRNIIRKSGARIAVIASENSLENSIAAAKKSGNCHANIVLTMQRKGHIFTTFFQQLFTDMKQGTTMPIAWGKLAPQSGEMDRDNPLALMLTEAGHVAFKQ